MHYITYLVTALSIVGTVANSFQKRWCFIVWGCTNTFWAIYNITTKQYAQAILYAFNFIMAVIGFAKWKKNSEADKKVDDPPCGTAELVERINNALGIKLYEWQIVYIFYMEVIDFLKWKKTSEVDKKVDEPPCGTAELVERINNALGIELYAWQIDYIFYDGEYHGEDKYGRRNGKTTANALKLCLSNGEKICVGRRERAKFNDEVKFFAKEDSANLHRLDCFMNEVFLIHKKLEAAGEIKLRDIWFGE